MSVRAAAAAASTPRRCLHMFLRLTERSVLLCLPWLRRPSSPADLTDHVVLYLATVGTLILNMLLAQPAGAYIAQFVFVCRGGVLQGYAAAPVLAYLNVARAGWLASDEFYATFVLAWYASPRVLFHTMATLVASRCMCVCRWCCLFSPKDAFFKALNHPAAKVTVAAPSSPVAAILLTSPLCRPLCITADGGGARTCCAGYHAGV